MIAAVIPSRDCPPALLALLEADGVTPFVVDGNGPPAIYAWWNVGVKRAREAGADCIAILNDDVSLLPGSLAAMAELLDDPTIGVVYPNVNRPLTEGIADEGTVDTAGTFGAGGMTGFAFMFGADLGIPFDESYRWWFGDDAFEAEVRGMGLRVCRAVGIPVAHEIDEHAMGATAGERWAEIAPLIEQDRRRWEARHLPEIALVMIVRDEAKLIERCLAAARPYISTWTIADTGSTDGTQDLIRKALVGIPGSLIESPWVDFGANRTEAITLARGTAEWLLCLDADMAVTIDPDWTPDPLVEQFLVEWGHGNGFSWRMPTLVRGDVAWSYVGAVHEYLTGGTGLRQFTDAVCIDMSAQEGRYTPAKYERYESALEASLAADPDNPRTVYYLAQTCQILGRVEEARALFLRRAKMGGYAEEAFHAAYQAALLAPDWPTRAVELLAAWEMRPSRMEPLRDLLRGLNERSLHHAAYALSATSAGPNGDILFVQRDAADWGVTFERSIAAWWCNAREEAADLNERLLANPNLPDHIRHQVETNQTYCEVA